MTEPPRFMDEFDPIKGSIAVEKLLRDHGNDLLADKEAERRKRLKGARDLSRCVIEIYSTSFVRESKHGRWPVEAVKRTRLEGWRVPTSPGPIEQRFTVKNGEAFKLRQLPSVPFPNDGFIGATADD